jgi:hypothetical protein
MGEDFIRKGERNISRLIKKEMREINHFESSCPVVVFNNIHAGQTGVDIQASYA